MVMTAFSPGQRFGGHEYLLKFLLVGDSDVGKVRGRRIGVGDKRAADNLSIAFVVVSFRIEPYEMRWAAISPSSISTPSTFAIAYAELWEEI